MRLFLLWIASAATIVGLAYLLPWVQVESFGVAMVVALVLGLINVTIKPILLLFTLPLNLLTLGLLTFVINALMVLLTDNLVSGFDAGNFWTALIVSVAVTFVTSLLVDAKK